MAPRSSTPRSRSVVKATPSSSTKPVAAEGLIAVLGAPKFEPVATSTTHFAKGTHESPILGGFWGLSNIMSMLICGGEVVAGVALAAKPLLWLKCFAILFTAFSAFIMFFSVFIIGLCASFGTKMQPAGRKTPPIGIEALDSIRAMWVFAGLAAWPYMMFVDGQKMGLVFTLAEAQPWAPTSIPLYLLQLAVLTLIVDGYSYVKHKAMHSGLLWEFHKTHHTYRDPTAFASFAVHPVEAFLTFVPVLGMCRAEMPVWAHAYAIWTTAWALINLYLHSGYEINALERVMAPLLINTSGYHNHHHEKMYTNFAELLYVWDVIMNTGFHPTGYGYGRQTLSKDVKAKST